MATTTSPSIGRKDQFSRYVNLSTGAATVFTDQRQSYGLGWDDVAVRNKNPLYLYQIAKGVDASTYYKRSSTLIHPGRAGAAWTFSEYGIPHFSDAIISWSGQHANLSTASDSTLRDIALKRLKRRINNLTESYQALIPLAELREVRTLVGDMTHLTTDVVQALINLKRTRGRSIFKLASKLWLTYSFGISPMMSDLRDATQSLWAYLTKGDVRDRVQGSATKDWLGDGFSGTLQGGKLVPIVYSTSAHHTLSYRFAAGWKFLIRSSNDYTAADHFGLKPPHLIPALWETTAFSWVVDYFTTIGEFLEDTFVGQAGSSIYVVENRLYRATSTCDFNYSAFDPTVRFVSNRGGRAIVERFEFERTPQTALPPRVLRWKTMDETGLHGVTKLLNLVAILGGKR